MRAAAGEYVFLVNSDVEFAEGFIRPLIDTMAQPDCVAAAPRILNMDRTTLQNGVNLGTFPGGHIMIWNESQTELSPAQGILPTVYAVGAAMFFKKNALDELGYFDELYCPSNWEDIDLCYMAWQRGWRINYQPASVLYHHLHLTIDREYSSYNIECLAAKNEYTFIWKNIYDVKYIYHHLGLLGARLYKKIWDGELAALHGFCWALLNLPHIIRRRQVGHAELVKSDREIFAGIMERYVATERETKKRPKLLFITQELPWPLDTGGKNRNYTMLKRTSREVDIYLLALSPNWQDEDLGHLDFCAEVKPITKKFLPVMGKFDEYPYSIIENSENDLYGAINEAIDSWRPDVICYDSLLVSIYSLLNPVGIPTIYVEHDIGMIDYRDSYLWRHRSGNGWTWFCEAMKLLVYEKKIADMADELVVLTDYDRDYLQALGVSTPMTVIPTAADLEKFIPAPGRHYDDVPTLAYLGHFGHYPNVTAIMDFCHEVWPKLKEKYPTLKLKIIGSAPAPEILELAAADKMIEVTGYVEDLAASLEGDYIFIAPISQRGGIRGKVLQAMSMALPVVASSAAVSGFTPALRKTVRAAATTQEFIDQLDVLLRDGNLRKQEGMAARRTLEKHYSWDVSADRFVEVIRRTGIRAINYPVRNL